MINMYMKRSASAPGVEQLSKSEILMIVSKYFSQTQQLLIWAPRPVVGVRLRLKETVKKLLLLICCLLMACQDW
jgi:hypothetical protein